MYDLKVIDMPHTMNRFFFGSRVVDMLDPMRQARWSELKDQETLDRFEQEEFAELVVEYAEVKAGLTLHAIMSFLLMVQRKYPSTVTVLAWDKDSWRYNEFDGYKIDRKLKKEKQTDDERYVWEKVYEAMEGLREMIDKTSLINLMVSGAEADDIIAFLSKNGKVLTITSDSDCHQVLTNPSAKVYDPIKDKMIKMSIEEAQYALFFKCIRGDKSDSIPSAKPRVLEKKIKVWFADNLEWMTALSEDVEMATKFERNEKLISFDRIPLYVKDLVYEAFENELNKDTPEYSFTDWAVFCRKFKQNELLGKLDEVKRLMY